MFRSFKKRNNNSYTIHENYIENSYPYIENDLYIGNFNDYNYSFRDRSENSPINKELCQSYVPYQVLQKTFTPEAGLQMGSVFPDLISEYYPLQSVEDLNYIASSNVQGGDNNG